MRIDLNADVGEGFGVWHLGDDEAMLQVVTSASVACGFHAGDPATMRRICETAAERGVAVGAQVSYRDLAGFGRRRMDVEPDALYTDVLYQIGALDGFARAAGTRVRYVKAHGALYNTAADDAGQAGAVVRAVAAYDPGVPLLGLPGSAVAAAAAEQGVGFVAEAFADRAYTSGGRLVPRSRPGAVLHDVTAVAERAVRIARGGGVTAIDGAEVDLVAQSLCVHGDTPGAVELARAVRAALTRAGVQIGPFA